MKLSRFHFSLIIIFIGYSCSFFSIPNFSVEQYEFSGLRVVFADLEDSYKRSKNFNKIWSKIHKNRYRPYFRFAGKSYIIDGVLNKYKQGFLILKDEKGNLKKAFKLDKNLSSGEFVILFYKDDAVEDFSKADLLFNLLKNKLPIKEIAKLSEKLFKNNKNKAYKRYLSFSKRN